MNPLFADVALPLPLPRALTYEVPEAFVPWAQPGARARARVGPRRLTGVIVEVHGNRPEGVNVRPLDEVLDREPVLPPDLLELARFTADYYRAPIGEVLRSMLPADLPPWGELRVRLTDAGALAPPRDAGEAAVVDALRDGGWASAGDLQGRLGLPDLDAVLSRLRDAGRVAAREGRSGSARYVAGVELAPGDLAAHLAAVGRSAPGRALVEWLAALGRPATTEEALATIGCSAGVVRRLVFRGILRQFTQVERLSLDRHMLGLPGGRGEITLRGDQETALGRVVESLGRREYAPFLLQGMTGSGKTEVYLRAAEFALELGRSVVLLVPEIALVPALARSVERRFGERLAILHSGLGSGERQQEWERVRSGGARVVLGPRSALFAPVRDLGLVVVDEEQDTSYKQEIAPRYNARDLSLVRARAAGAAVVLVSATPSLESRYNAERGKLESLNLTARAGQGSLPEGILVDLRQEGLSRRPGRSTSPSGSRRRSPGQWRRRSRSSCCATAAATPRCSSAGPAARTCAAATAACRGPSTAGHAPSSATTAAPACARRSAARSAPRRPWRRSAPAPSGWTRTSGSCSPGCRWTCSTATRRAGRAARRPCWSVSPAARCGCSSAPRWSPRGTTSRRWR
jgi:primosomal protein N' (replication factor Y) (superfamily II helicase)